MNLSRAGFYEARWTARFFYFWRDDGRDYGFSVVSGYIGLAGVYIFSMVVRFETESDAMVSLWFHVDYHLRACTAFREISTCICCDETKKFL